MLELRPALAMKLVDKAQRTAHWFFEMVAVRIFARAAAVATGMIQMAAQLAGGRELTALRAHMRGLRPLRLWVCFVLVPWAARNSARDIGKHSAASAQRCRGLSSPRPARCGCVAL